ncbi:RNA-dependent RNA polymerase [American bat vesiculovirus]|uniref:RNA-directed RNA polymerase L n=1 Tax=American bat vesiculovirus TaxID=1972564 RepID=A0A7T0MBZ1_9RHAB|nr:RNA-dependent RNA polymerase [American bat vesiculovirus]
MDLIEENDDWGLPQESDFSPEGVYSEDDRISFMNTYDYNLNSPLISDDVDYLIARHYGYNVPSIWQKKDLSCPLSWMEEAKKDWHKSTEHHKWFGSWIKSENHEVTQGVSFLNRVEAESILTHEIVESFLWAWCRNEIKYISKGQGWGMKRCYALAQKFLDLHKVILQMNASSLTEVQNLQVLLNTIEVRGGHKFQLHSLGTVVVSKNFLFLTHSSQVFDRNFVLMMKDVVIGRLQTTLAMINRVDSKFGPDSIRILYNVYNLGDRALAAIGSKAYDSIKMIEPICNLRLTELAHGYRPLIPTFPKFGDHVQKTVQELTLECAEIREIFEIIKHIDDVELVLLIYGSFRHWGHPYIDYFAGLEKLHQQVTVKKDIDTRYANALASDLAKMVLQQMFREKKKWFVSADLLDKKHPFYNHVIQNSWPTSAQILDFGDRWHELPLVKCFDIPDLIDPSVIYADKSHSMNRSDVIRHILYKSDSPIPSRKVMKTMLETPATNWVEFLESVDKVGLDAEDLVIGLKAKERELKTVGRFFSLMSWKLREYFVITEYLIKTHFVPLFHGLTMADDLTAVMKKMMESSSGQGASNYDAIAIANHIDYEKWNNHQRKESNGPVFKVMGQFLGYPNLISRTHEFFENSLIYYNNRPDLMRVLNNAVENSSDKRVCWNGQAGGLEGLRQKGWSILNLLVIARESQIRNTSVKTLAQGDNQVICTQYKTKNYRNENELICLLEQIKLNNQAIMDAIESGTTKLGLIINQDETMQSADYLNYGKVPIFRGVIRGLECKRWSRVTCVTNDQLPTCANLMSSVSTNALTVAHFDQDPVNAIVQYNYFGNFTRLLMEMHNPAMRSPLSATHIHYNTLAFKISVLYLDPSIGGVCGTALTRFLIRSFPDPVTESLTFWKMIYPFVRTQKVKQLCIAFGNPKIAKFRPDHIEKLLEDPTSLNMAMGVSPTNLIKTQIKNNLIQNRNNIENRIVRDAVTHIHQDDEDMRNFLWSIEPLFPRFLSEFKSGSFMGVATSVVSLFQNSRTIRNIFKNRMGKDLDGIISNSEKTSLEHLASYDKESSKSIWNCSATQADYLRIQSWGRPVLGTTVPHPAEMHGSGEKKTPHSTCCNSSKFDYISVHCPKGLFNTLSERGPLPAYLGSKTSESTSILQPWERETKIPVIRRATRLRDAIHWFIEPNSNLARSIINNIESLTGEIWSVSLEGFKRTGSALHRFTTSRVSHGGFSAQSPAKLTRMLSTTDTMRDLGDINYDFMYQASLLYSQISTSVILDGSKFSGVVHFHIKCLECLREIVEPTLDTIKEYRPVKVDHILSAWKNSGSSWGDPVVHLKIKKGDWGVLNAFQKSYHIGRAIGFLYGDLINQRSRRAEDSSIFPLSLQYHLNGTGFLRGILNGLVRASCCQVIHRHNIHAIKRPANSIFGGLIFLIDQISDSAPFQNLCRAGPIREALNGIPHKVPASYPTSNSDLGLSIRNYLKYQCKRIERGQYKDDFQEIWIFSDTMSVSFAGPIALSSSIMSCLYKPTLKKQDKDTLRVLSNLSSMMRSGEIWGEAENALLQNNLLACPEEIRHAGKGITIPDTPSNLPLKWGREYSGSVLSTEVSLSVNTEHNQLKRPPRVSDPLVSGLRAAQLPTGGHYKIRTLIKGFGIHYQDFLCGGDGSGGMTAALLRISPKSKCIFNSLLDYDQSNMRGSSPDPPSALETAPNSEYRCVNSTTCWEDQSDLTLDETWTTFYKYKEKYNLKINLLVLDMESVTDEATNTIAKMVRIHMNNLLETDSHVIFKTYGTIIAGKQENPLSILAPLFERTYIAQTTVSSSHTSELYIVGRHFRKSSTNLHIIWSDLEVWWENLFAFRGYQSEFERAILLSQANTQEGVPLSLLQDPWISLETLLQIAGVPGGVSHNVCMELKNHSFVFLEVTYILSSMVSSFTINHTKIYSKRPGPPSDGSVTRMASALTGIFFTLALRYNDIKLYTLLYKLNNIAFPIRIRVMKLIKGYKIAWSCHGDSDFAKDCRLNAQQANIGQWIRTLHRCNIPRGMPDYKKVNRVLRQVNEKLQVKSTIDSTGIKDIFERKIDPEDKSVPFAVCEVIKVDNWCD